MERTWIRTNGDYDDGEIVCFELLEARRSILRGARLVVEIDGRGNAANRLSPPLAAGEPSVVRRPA
jgi:hypothetical protein